MATQLAPESEQTLSFKELCKDFLSHAPTDAALHKKLFELDGFTGVDQILFLHECDKQQTFGKTVF